MLYFFQNSASVLEIINTNNYYNHIGEGTVPELKAFILINITGKSFRKPVFMIMEQGCICLIWEDGEWLIH
ncbi:hypothetical protein M9991_11005 [Chryseobacterium gallinarum]|nr:hypothetical protein [Chryseobacterium gallinarum]MCL8537388.1 hypothetical protein [Chryseobacterium gallinarum]